MPQPVQPINREGWERRKVGVIGNADIPNIDTVKTKIVNVFANQIYASPGCRCVKRLLKGEAKSRSSVS